MTIVNYVDLAEQQEQLESAVRQFEMEKASASYGKAKGPKKAGNQAEDIINSQVNN